MFDSIQLELLAKSISSNCWTRDKIPEISQITRALQTEYKKQTGKHLHVSVTEQLANVS
jgi:hypothetical protein